MVYSSLIIFKTYSLMVEDCIIKTSEGQETGAIAPAPENDHKKFEGRGRLLP
jgi:hypothetical protein